MKRIALGLLAATAISGFAQAADLDVDPVIAAENYQFFVVGKIGAGPSIIDNDFVTTTPPAAGSTVSTGNFEDDWLAAVGVEAGMFLTDNIRISATVNIGRIEHDVEVVSTNNSPFPGATQPGTEVPLSGHTKIYQGFAKLAYETPLADLGFTSPFFERSSVFAVGGIGFTHLRSKASLVVNPLAPFDADEEDTVLSGLVGFGTVYRLTENIDLVSETNFIFGGDADLGFTIPGAGTAVTQAETQALASQLGIRFRF